MELADLTRGMRKKKLEPEKLIFGKPGLSEFQEGSAEKCIFLDPEKLFFAQLQPMLNPALCKAKRENEKAKFLEGKAPVS